MQNTEAIEANKAVLRGLLDQVYKKGNVDLIDRYFAEHVINHVSSAGGSQDPHWGAQQQKDYLIKAFENLKDWKVEYDEPIAERDKVAVRWTFSGTQKDTNETFGVIHQFIYRISEGKIVEVWHCWQAL